MQLQLLLITFLQFAIAGKTDFYMSLAKSAEDLTHQNVKYDPSYYKIEYPMGDVPADKGVCADVVVRAYRKMGIDLQTLVHEDMKLNFHVYPKIWGLKKCDTNIDHRRVPNLMTFFSRAGSSCTISNKSKDYQPGDIVCWQLNSGAKHIGIVSSKYSFIHGRYYMVHNIGSGQVIEDCLFSFTIIGH